eukprot:8615074-Lingulodinium_polyedra.AAC.1
MAELVVAPAWRAVGGPAAAARCALRRLGWRWPRRDVFAARDGARLPLGVVRPADLKHLAREATQA